jgi:hypothetical protein
MVLSVFPYLYVLGRSFPERLPISPFNPNVQHAPGDDQYGYEDAGERWMPVHTVESIVSHPL